MVQETFLKQLEEIITEFEPSSIFKEGDDWWVATEWLVGTFAGRAFVNTNKQAALLEMHKYFISNLGNDSMVGDIVKKSGYPDLDSVKLYIKSKINDYDT